MRSWRKRREQDFQREIASHLQAEGDEQREQGISKAEAGYAARRAFGNTTLVQENTRAVWGWGSIERLGQDLRYALRLLRKSPAFTATAILSLTLGIGMNTAIFTLVDAVLLRNLPVPAPDELVLLAERAGSRQVFSLSSRQFAAVRENDTLTGLAAFRPWRFRTAVHGEPQLANGQLVTGNYFSLLGVRAHLGRTFSEQDDLVPGANPVAVLSYHYWQREFDSDANVIGQTIELQGYPFTIVGVAVPEFFGLEPGKKIDITVPLTMHAVAMPGTSSGTPSSEPPDARWLRLIGRRKPGVTLEQARANLAVRWMHLQASSTRRRGAPDSRLEVLPGGQGLYDLRRQFSLPLRILMGVVALVLLVACANLASLLLARATARQQEIRLRLSLGASRGRLLRQLVTESMLLSTVGAIGGLALAYWTSSLLVDVMSRGRGPIVLDLAIHTRTLLFTTLVSLVTGLLFGIVPALRATNTKSLHGARVTVNTARLWTGALIVTQVALCLTVLACAGLLLGSLRKLRQVDPGFQKDHVLLMSIRPALSKYNGPQSARLYGELYRRFSSLPGVKSVTPSMDTPLGGGKYTTEAFLPGSARLQPEALQVNVNSVGPRFFETMGIPLLSGRDLNIRDGDHGAQVALISESLALALFPGRSALGEHFKTDQWSVEVIGVAKDTRYQSLREPTQPMMYRPYLQMPDTWEELFFGIRTAGDPEVIANLVRRELHSAAPNVPVFSLSTLEERVDATLVQERIVSTLSAWFGGFALLLASIGLYGRLAYAVVERTREIGIRLALGARRAVVMWTILREVLLLALCGVAIGLPLAMVSTRAIRTLLYGVTPFDPSTLSFVAIVILGVAALAGYVPARRAAHVDPMVALRYE